MKKFIIVLSLVFIASILSFGQQKSDKVIITTGQDLKESKKLTLKDIAGFDEDGIYNVKCRRKGYRFVTETVVIECLNKKMQIINSVQSELGYGDLETKYEFIIHLHNELFIFYSTLDDYKAINTLYVQKVNKKTLKPYDESLDIAEIDYSGLPRYNRGEYFFKLSPDSSKLLVYYGLSYNSRDYIKFGFNVFDNQLELLWQKDVRLPYKDELVDIEDHKVDNSGNVHLLALIYKDKRKKKRRGESNYKYQILSYHDEGNEMIQYPVKLVGKFITDMKIATSDGQDIICAGFYSEEGVGSIRGTYYLKVDKESKEITEHNLKEFDIDFITQHMSDKEVAKTAKKISKGKDVEMEDYVLEDLVIRDDGGAILIGEQFYITTSAKSSSDGGMTEVDHYHFNDIIVVNILADGSIDWAQKIAKMQKSTDGGYWSSFAYALVDESLFFIFNDNPKNLYYQSESKLFRFTPGKESLVLLIEVDGEGNQSRGALFSTSETDSLMLPWSCTQISGNEMVLYGKKKKVNRFAMITFK